MITQSTVAHREALLTMLEASGQFDEGGLAHVRDTLDAHLASPGDAIWLSALGDDQEPVGVVYCAPEPLTDGTWNLLMLWVEAGRERNGFGKALVAAVESELASRGVRLLIVETSQLPAFEGARAFYQKCGFSLEARIADFFAAGDDKLIYTKRGLATR